MPTMANHTTTFFSLFTPSDEFIIRVVNIPQCYTVMATVLTLIFTCCGRKVPRPFWAWIQSRLHRDDPADPAEPTTDPVDGVDAVHAAKSAKTVANAAGA